MTALTRDPATDPPAGDEDDGLTAELADGLVSAIADECMPRKFAATYNGVSPKTLERWIAMGATGSGSAKHRELAKRILKAEGGKVGRVMRCLNELAAEDGKAGEAFLKLFKPGDFGGPRREPDEFDSIERNAQKQDKLLESPPPRLRAKMTAHGWWQFRELSPEDRETLRDIQGKHQPQAAALLTAPSPEKAPRKKAPQSGA
jgi:hypothetical protein